MITCGQCVYVYPIYVLFVISLSSPIIICGQCVFYLAIMFSKSMFLASCVFAVLVGVAFNGMLYASLKL